MAVLLLFLRLILGGVFLISAVYKLVDLSGFRRALSNFGVPSLGLWPLCVILPLVELGIAGGLLAVSTAWFAAVSAFGLLLLFTTAIAANMARGRMPDCRCFGQLHNRPIGWSTVGRNLLLAAIAGIVVWQGHADAGASVVGWVLALTAGQRVVLAGFLFVLVFLGFEAWLLFQLLAQQGRLLLRLDAIESKLNTNISFPRLEGIEADRTTRAGLPVGSLAPKFQLPNISGERITLDFILARQKPALLVFTDPSCRPCNMLLPDIGRWQREMASSVTLVIISRGSASENQSKAVEYGLNDVLLQINREVADAYEANGTPAMVLIREEGQIGSPMISGPQAIKQMLFQLNATFSRVPLYQPDDGSRGNGKNLAPTKVVLKIGDPAPPLTLPNLAGEMISLDGLRGTETLVLFWNPQCGFCNRMLDDLKLWETNSSGGAPKLLVVSTGSVEVNQALGLVSPILLESGFQAASSFGASGTPSAILVDREGKIASDVAIGASEVLKLARLEVAI